jgi:hypothetical protein
MELQQQGMLCCSCSVTYCVVWLAASHFSMHLMPPSIYCIDCCLTAGRPFGHGLVIQALHWSKCLKQAGCVWWCQNQWFFKVTSTYHQRCTAELDSVFGDVSELATTIYRDTLAGEHTASHEMVQAYVLN